ncbi:MAG: AraC family transcriptional regulator [Coprobacillaceae bacterium]
MSNNIERIMEVIEYIEGHLDGELSLSELSKVTNYSKYHLHRMFTSIIGFPMHLYIQRRRLTEAARLLSTTNNSIMDIALSSGYTTQQSFNDSFKKLYRKTPNAYRKQSDFQPIQLKFDVNNDRQTLRADRTLDVKTVDYRSIQIIGYQVNTKYGFITIPKAWRKLQKTKHLIENRLDFDYQIGINDYSKELECNEKQPTFDHYAGVEVSNINQIPDGMVGKILPPSKYVIFYLRGNQKESMQPIIEYIYRVWFPESTCVFNEELQFDFERCGEEIDKNGESDIEIWVPII